MGKHTGNPRGRPAGSKNRATTERELRAAAGVKAAIEGGELPLDVMLRVMRGDGTVTDRQFQAAIAAAPYVHPRLAATEMKLESENEHRVVFEAPMTEEEWLALYGRKDEPAPG